MKTLKTLTAISFAALFAVGANAGEFSNSSYEDYAESSSWPTDTANQSSTSLADVNKMMETNPTAAGGSRDLSGFDYEDYAQSATWPTDNSRITVPSTSFADVKTMMETNPTAAGASHVGDGNILGYDLLGEDIHSQ